MWAACGKIIVDNIYNHDPNMQDIHGMTVAMNLAFRGIIPPI